MSRVGAEGPDVPAQLPETRKRYYLPWLKRSLQCLRLVRACVGVLPAFLLAKGQIPSPGQNAFNTMPERVGIGGIAVELVLVTIGVASVTVCAWVSGQEDRRASRKARGGGCIRGQTTGLRVHRVKTRFVSRLSFA